MEYRRPRPACFEKGADFIGWWHDLGGEDDAVLTLIETALHQRRTAQATTLIPP